MGIFKNITKTLKKAAPLIGSTIGFALGGPAGAAIGSGIGSLAAGRSAEEALMNAGMAYGVGSFAKGAGFTQAPDSATGISQFLPGRVTQAAGETGLSVAPNFGIGAVDKVPVSSMLKDSGNSIFKFIGDNPLLTAGGVGALALASGQDEEKVDPIQKSPFPEGESRLGVVPYKGVVYNLDNKAERDAYNQKRQSGLGTMFAAVGGEVEGPGTGTSDSVPARLSDGEFVVTAKAVRGAGGGDRNVGAARMYDMMSNLERVA